MFDISIIGGGPAGLSAALNARVLNKTVCLFSTGTNNLSRAKKVDNYLGFDGIDGPTLMSCFYKHLAKHGVKPNKSRITNILPFDNNFLISVGNNIIESRSIILATGIQRKREVPGENEFLGKGVSYCAICDGSLYVNKNAVVWGFSHEAAMEANFLDKLGVKVTFVSNPKYKSNLNNHIRYIDGKILNIKGRKSVEYITLDSGKIETDAVFILRENISVQKLIASLEMNESYIRVNNKMMTNINGVFAAGDCTGKPLQVAKAVSDGLIAAQSAASYIDKLSGR